MVESFHIEEKDENKDTLDIIKKQLAPEHLDKNKKYSSDSSDEEEKMMINESFFIIIQIHLKYYNLIIKKTILNSII